MSPRAAHESPKDYLKRLYETLYQQARTVYPHLPPTPPPFHVEKKARTTERSFAFFAYSKTAEGRAPTAQQVAATSIHASPLLAENAGHAEGVLAHEIGHLVDFVYGDNARRAALLDTLRLDSGHSYAQAGVPLPRSKERLADAIAESFLGPGKVIKYDCSEDGECGLVQTTDPGVEGIRPRPKGLG